MMRQDGTACALQRSMTYIEKDVYGLQIVPEDLHITILIILGQVKTL